MGGNPRRRAVEQAKACQGSLDVDLGLVRHHRAEWVNGPALAVLSELPQVNLAGANVGAKPCAYPYAHESAFEAVTRAEAMTITFDYQHVENPAYNQERGSADFFAKCLYVDF
ncbi:hypothetical protein [Methylorubrum extorquens]